MARWWQTAAALGAVFAFAALSGLGSTPARADYYTGDGGYGNAGGYSNYGGGYTNYGGGYYGGGYGGSNPIISLELNEKESLNSSLRVAARENRINDLRKFLAQGGEINSQSDAGDTALIYASRNCSTKIVRLLLDLKANVNVRDRMGRTALMYAASDGCAPVVKMLLEVQDIDLAAKDRENHGIRDYALDGYQLEMGGPAAETYMLIRDAERARARKARQARAAANR